MIKLLKDLPCAIGIFDTFERMCCAAVSGAGIGDLDLAFFVLGDINTFDINIIARCVVDIDVGVAVGHAQRAVTGADDLPGQDNFAALGHDLLNDNALVGGIPIPIHGDAIAEGDAGQGGIEFICQCGGLRGQRKRTGNIHLNIVGAALNQAVDIKVLSGDGDPALGQNSALVACNRFIQLWIDRAGTRGARRGHEVAVEIYRGARYVGSEYTLNIVGSEIGRIVRCIG